MSNSIPTPQNISFVDWASSLNDLMPSLQIPVALDPEDWENWINAFMQINALTALQVPSSQEKWQDWAQALISLYEQTE